MQKNSFNLFLRYAVLLLLAIPGFQVFYFIFTPLTVYPVFLLLKMIYSDVALNGTLISFSLVNANIVSACVAGAAYYLLLILNLSTPMKSSKRAKSLAFLLVVFLIANIIRIFIFAIIADKGFQYFDIAHTASWYFGSTILVLLIWFANVLIFNIKSLPMATDLNLLIKNIKWRQKSRSSSS